MQQVHGSYPYRVRVESLSDPEFHELQPRYGWVNELWDKSKHVHQPHPSLQGRKPKIGICTLVLKCFRQTMTSDEVINWAEPNGYRACFPCEREAFTKLFHDLIFFYWIPDLGTLVRDDNGITFVPILRGDVTQTRLGGTAYDGPWSGTGRFLLAKA